MAVALGDSPPALELISVSHAYAGVPAVQEVSLALQPGEVVCLVGPSGCGKSTVLRLAAGLETLQRGEVRMAGQAVATPARTVPPEQRQIGLVFQDFALFPHLTVRGNIAFGLRGLSADQRGQRVEALLHRIDLASHGDRFPHELSGGQQQRVALARALAPHPRVMLMDEPFSGLDVGLRGDIRDNTLALLKESGTATLFVTHDPEEAMLSADRIVLMRGGRLVQVGRPVDLYRHPVDPFAAGFFGRVNRFTGVVRAGQVATVLGPVSTRLPEGSAAQVLVRHEAVKLVPAAAPDAAAPRLRDLRTLGRATLLTLDCPDGTVVHARIPGTVELPPGGPVALTVDVERAYVFPADG